jgi:predicted MPP superfamily phosphohydrolase
MFGHLGICVALYNRINATGLNRLTIKRIEKAIVLLCTAAPISLAAFELGSGSFANWNIQRENLSFASILYLGIGVFSAIAMFPFWIADRPRFAIAWERFTTVHEENVHQLHLRTPEAIQGNSFRKMARLPGNQIASLQCNHKRLAIDGLPNALHGFKIVHLSDIHLTGQLGVPFYRKAMDWVAQLQPDLILLSGDIVDYEHALDMIEPVFHGLEAAWGKYFVLGNHDRRLADPSLICKRLKSVGWVDLGAENIEFQAHGTLVRLLGNEAPWFYRHAEKPGFSTASQTGSVPGLIIGVAHSPDQFGWGIDQNCHLILCGHTHGGQIRFPGIGPVVAPSWFGSRYASGVFAKNQSVMHVSRGLSGVHPFRWGCLPEVSLLELLPKDSVPPIQGIHCISQTSN